MEVLKELLLLGLSARLQKPTPAVLIAQVLVCPKTVRTSSDGHPTADLHTLSSENILMKKTGRLSGVAGPFLSGHLASASCNRTLHRSLA
eukprot:2198011-Rhodomonas_salina.1